LFFVRDVEMKFHHSEEKMLLSRILKNVTVLSHNLPVGNEKIDIGGISTDSRTVKQGDIFVSIRGVHKNGDDFIPEALLRGAKIIVVREGTKVPEGATYIVTSDTRYACSMMWSNFYGSPGDSLRIVCVTGSCGKTTTSFLLRDILSANGQKVGIIGTVKSMIDGAEIESDGGSEVSDIPSAMTTPDPKYLYGMLRQMADEKCDTVILEASSHALYQRKLDPLHVELSLFTNLYPEHLDFHISMEAYFRAKCHLFALSEKGIALVRSQNDYGARITEYAPKCRMKYVLSDEYSASVEKREPIRNITADFIFSPIETADNSVTSFDFSVSDGNKTNIFIPMLGSFISENGAICAAAAYELGVPLNIIASALSNTCGVEGRMETVYSGIFTVIRDFAHTPSAMEKVLTGLRKNTDGRIITVFGCGGDRDKTKRAPMGERATALSEITVITSDNSRTENPEAIIADIMKGVHRESKYTVIPDRTEAIEFALSVADKGDIVILMGKGHETYEIDKYGKHPFDEKRIAEEFIRKNINN